MQGTPTRGCFPSINSSSLAHMDFPVTTQEVSRALFDMSPLKALRIDGLHPLFYQS